MNNVSHYQLIEVRNMNQYEIQWFTDVMFEVRLTCSRFDHTLERRCALLRNLKLWQNI